MIGFIILSVVGAAVLYGLIGFIQMRRTQDKFPGPPTRFLSTLHEVNPERVSNTLELDRQFDGLYRVYFAPWIPSLWISKSKYAKVFLKSNTPKATEFYFSLSPWLGTGLLLASGKRWSRSRRLLTPAFHFDILKPYMDVYNEAANTLLDVLAPRAADGKYFDVMNEISRMTFDVILRCAMSAESNCQTEKGPNPYVDAVIAISFLSMDRSATPLHRPDWIYWLTSNGREFKKQLATLHAMSFEVIRKRKAELAEDASVVHTSKYRDFLDILLTAKDENGQGLTDKEIRDEVDTFMFEGHDTTAHGIGWTLHCLGLNPDIQNRCREEVDKVMGGRDHDLTWADMDKLEYLQMCIREAMRLFPPVPVIGRVAQEDMQLGEHTVKKGSSVVVSIVGMHRDPEQFDNPEEYRPSRFAADAPKKADAFSYVPFSAGPRNCIGQVFASHEEKVTVAKILSRYVIETDPDYDIQLRFALVLRPAGGLRVRLRPRDD